MMFRLVAFILLFLGASAGAQTSQPRLPILRDVGIDQKLNVQVPADLPFRDERARDVKLGDYFGKRPMILALVYYKCPGLCTMVLNDITRAMNSMRATCGQQFDIITVSFDPHETPDLALEKKQQYLRAYQRASAKTGWHFLTGDAPSIDRLTKAVGFRYAWDQKYQQYAHASGIIVLTPEGKTSRYFYGIDYAPADLELSLAEASQGKAVSITDRVLLYCFHYDPATGKYSLIVTRIVQAGGVITVLVLAGMIWLLSRTGPKKAHAPAFPLSGRPGDAGGGPR